MATSTTTPSENKMQYVRLGNTGLKVSRICLGMMSYGDPKWREWILPESEGRVFIKKALELGINFFDTADVYSYGVSEEVLGNAIADFAKRDQVVIATKVYGKMGEGPNDQGLSRKHIFHSIENSLKRLKMDYVDLYQIHRWDNNTPIEETMEALHDLVKSGKVRYIGASSMRAWQFAKAQAIAEKRGWTKFVSMQNHYNLVYREEEREMIPLCNDQGVGIIPWSPLARGLLTRPRNQESTRTKSDAFAKKLYTEEADFDIVDRVAELAKQRGASPATVGLAWLLHKGVTAPIIGATKMSHLEDAVAAVNFKLSAEEIASLEEPYRPHAQNDANF